MVDVLLKGHAYVAKLFELTNRHGPKQSSSHPTKNGWLLAKNNSFENNPDYTYYFKTTILLVRENSS